MGGLDTTTFLELNKKHTVYLLYKKANAHLKVIILNSIDKETPFLEKIRYLAYSTGRNSGLDLIRAIEETAAKNIHAQVAIILRKLKDMRFTGSDLLKYNNEYLQLILKLSKSKDFTIDTSRKMDYLESLGNGDLAARLRLYYAEHGYETSSLQDVMDKALSIFSISSILNKKTVAAVQYSQTPSPSIPPPHEYSPTSNPSTMFSNSNRRCTRCKEDHAWGNCPFYIPRCRYCDDGSFHWANACPTVKNAGSRNTAKSQTNTNNTSSTNSSKRKVACLQKHIFSVSTQSTGLVDSGAELTVTNDPNLLENISDFDDSAGTANRNYNIQLKRQGTITLKLKFGNTCIPAFYSPDVPCTLISTNDLNAHGIDVIFTANGKNYLQKGLEKHVLEENNHLSTTPTPIIQTKFPTYKGSSFHIKKVFMVPSINDKEENSWKSLHEQFSHCLSNDLQRTFNTSTPPKFSCDTCEVSNTQLSSYVNKPSLFPHRIRSNMVYCDYKVLKNPDRLILVITCRNWIGASFQKSKVETEENLFIFLEKHREYISLECVVPDEDSPFNNRRFIKRLKEKYSLDMKYVPPEKHQLNFAELTIKNYMKMLRSSYLDSPVKLRDKYFAELVQHIAFVKNRLGGRLSPYYKSFGHMFDISKLHRLFTTVNTIKREHPNNLDEKGLKCYFLGYNLTYVTPTATLLTMDTNQKIHRALVDCHHWADTPSPTRIRRTGLSPESFLHLLSNKFDSGFFKFTSNKILNINNLPAVDKRLVHAVTTGFDFIKAPVRIRNLLLHSLLKETVNIFEHDVLCQLTQNEIAHITKKIIKSSFVLAVKRNGDIKARWVAAETDNIRLSTIEDYAATVSPILFKLITILCLLFNLKLITIDFVAAFLNGIIEEETYISAPFPMNHIIFRVLGNMYGLKRAGRIWQSLLIRILKELGLHQSIVDDCLFFHKTNLFLIFHVDDVLLAATPKEMFKFINKLKAIFKVKVNTHLIS